MSKIAFLFPGQGAQKAGMGQDFYEKYPSARQIFDQASQWLSLDMKALCFEKNDRLNLTEYTQAALVTTCLAMEKVVEECGLHPDITAGLSLGEYCAIAVSGGMSVKDAIVTVRKRGILWNTQCRQEKALWHLSHSFHLKQQWHSTLQGLIRQLYPDEAHTPPPLFPLQDRWNEYERCHSNCAKKRNPYGTRSAGRRRLYGSCYRS